MGINRIGSIIFCCVFFALISTPMVLMPWAQNRLTENRLPTPVPELVVDGNINLSLPTDIEAYFGDRFAGRTQMIDAYSRMVGGVFGVSANDNVIMGKDGWLFFHETVGDFNGSAALSDEEINRLISDLLDLKRAAQERGQVFIIAIAPNKNSLYGDHMPTRYRRTQELTNLDRLLAADGLDCVDFRTVLLDSYETVYYKTDSHWNGLGARIAAREIMMIIEEKTGVAAQFDWDGGIYEMGFITGDLAQMLYPAGAPQEIDRIYEDARHRFSTIGRFRTLDDLRITTQSDGAPLRIAMYRDSFAISLIPYFSNAYSNAFYTRQTPPPLDSVEFLEADVIVIQIAERRLSELLGAWDKSP